MGNLVLYLRDFIALLLGIDHRNAQVYSNKLMCCGAVMLLVSVMHRYSCALYHPISNGSMVRLTLSSLIMSSDNSSGLKYLTIVISCPELLKCLLMIAISHDLNINSQI